MNLFSSPKERTRFIRFGIVGIIGSVVDFGFLNLFTIVFGLPDTLASMMSFILAVINNFIINRLWTYPDSKTTPIYKQLPQFALVSFVGLAIRTPLFPLLIKLLEPIASNVIPNFLTPAIVSRNVALAIVIGIVMLWNYFANRFWTFKNVPS
jgi:putative flippase GtrA